MESTEDIGMQTLKDPEFLKALFGLNRRTVVTEADLDTLHKFLEDEVYPVLPVHEDTEGGACECVRCRLVSVLWWIEDKHNEPLELECSYVAETRHKSAP